MMLRKTILLLLLILIKCSGLSQDKATFSFYVYKNTKRVYVNPSEISFSIKYNDTLHNVPIRQEFVDLGGGKEDELTLIELPILEIDSTQKVILTMLTPKYKISSNLSAFFRHFSSTARPTIILFYFYFTSFSNYESFKEGNNVVPDDFEPSKANFTKWQLFCFLQGHERWPYVPVEIVSVEKI